MIWITGDTHGEQARLLTPPAGGTWGADDILIVCGDFGFLFFDSAEEHAFLDRVEKLPCTVCFLDGNHENFDAIERFPQQDWNGGRARRIRENVFHLMRGQIFALQGHTFFTFGGAYSIDRYLRRENVSYWRQELPTDAEYKAAVKNLSANGMRADYILTHTAPKEIVLRMGYRPDAHELELEGFLEYLMYEVEYEQWFFGHWHQDRSVTDRFRCLWFDAVNIPPGNGSASSSGGNGRPPRAV